MQQNPWNTNLRSLQFDMFLVGEGKAVGEGWENSLGEGHGFVRSGMGNREGHGSGSGLAEPVRAYSIFHGQGRAGGMVHEIREDSRGNGVSTGMGGMWGGAEKP